MKRLVTLAAVLPLIAACGGTSPRASIAPPSITATPSEAATGVLTGVIERVGGPPVLHPRPAPGYITIWKPSSAAILPVAQTVVRQWGQHFRVVLPPGRYWAIVGTDLRKLDCPVLKVAVRADRETRITLDDFCGVP